MKVGLIIAGSAIGLFLLGIILVLVGLGFGWFSGEANLRSYNHVRATYAEAYDDANSLTAIAQQICIAKGAVTSAKASGDENVTSQRESQLLALDFNYERVRGEYDAYMNDHFRGKIIHPADLPFPEYPTLGEKLTEVC